MDIAEQLEICSKATAGPWIPFQPADDEGWWWVWQESKLPGYGGVADTSMRERDGSLAHACIDDSLNGTEQERCDAVFIAHARSNYPLALQELRDLLAKVEAVRNECEFAQRLSSNGNLRVLADKILKLLG